MDGNSFTSHPAISLALNISADQPMVPEGALAQRAAEVPAPPHPAANESVNHSIGMPAHNSPVISTRELLEGLRAGQLAAERAFLERARSSAEENQSSPLAKEAAPMVQPAPALSEALSPGQQSPELPSQTVPAVKKAEPAVSHDVVPVKVAPQVERHLTFSLRNVRYAVPLEHIIEIAELENYTPVPNVPEWIAGITNLRGDIISLVDLTALQGEAAADLTLGSNLLVTGLAADELTTSLVVDRVHGVASVNPDQIQRFDKMSGTGLSSFTRGYITDDAGLLCLLDLEALLHSMVLPR